MASLSSLNKRPRTGSSICTLCETDMQDKTRGIQCSVCSMSYCITCAKITEDLLKILNTEACNIMWTCTSCKGNFPTFTKVKTAIDNLTSTTEERFSKLETNLGKIDTVIEEKVKHKVEGEVNNIKQNLSKEIEGQVHKIFEKELRQELREIEDQKRRTMNLICFNLPESTATKTEERKVDDMQKFLDLCGKIGIQNVDINMCIRLGPANPQKTRALKVILNNKKQRNEIIENFRKIRNLQEHDLKRCIVTKDLTKKTKGGE